MNSAPKSDRRQRLASILSSLGEGVVATDAGGAVVLLNPAAERLTGWAVEQAVGRSLAEVVRLAAVDGETTIVDLARPVLEGVESHDTGARFELIDRLGARRPIAFHASPLRGPDCLVDGAVVVLRDMTEARRVDEQLRESQQFLEEAQTVAHIGSWVSALDREDSLVWSRETHRIFGIPEGSFDGRVQTFFDHVHPDDLAMIEAASAAAIRGEADYDVTHRIVRPDGVVRWVYQRATVSRAGDGTPLRMIGTVQDITERRAAEEELLQARKTEAIGLLAGRIAHDFNNLMTVVLSFASILIDRLDDEDELLEHACQIRHAGERAARLTRQLLAFGRQQVLQPCVVDLRDVVGPMLTFLRPLIGEDVDLQLMATSEPACVFVDPAQIEQVVMNLALNARDAMAHGGRLTIKIEHVHLDEDRARALFGARSGPHVLLSVADTGTGMDGATLAHIFEPYFTTKPAGSGLGLATVHGIVRQSGGAITVHSEARAGSRFDIFLPAHGSGAVRRPAAYQSDAAGMEPGDTSTRTILLVEDDPQVREVARVTLVSAGYRVLVAAGPSQALALARGLAEPLDLLVTDVVLPEMSGFRLADRLAAEIGGLRVLYVSGHTADAAGYQGLLEPGGDLLEKPFTPSGLLGRVRAALARASVA